METYSAELSADLGDLVELELRKLAGRTDGRPPPPLALALFFLTTGIFLLRRRKRYDAVHFGDFVLYPLAWWHALIDGATARFMTVHGLDLIYGNRNGLRPAVYRLFVAWARSRRCVDHFIANSRNTADITKQAGFGPVATIPLGVRIPEDYVAAPVAADVPYVLFVGRLVERKGAAWFAETVLPLLPDAVEFRVVGRVWDKDQGSRLQRCSRVKTYGFVADDELSRLKAGARVIVMPNLPSAGRTDVEGFGLTALEAAISGAPLVAARTDGIADAVIAGSTGFLLIPGDSHLWSEKIRELLDWTEQQRLAFSVSALEAVRRHYSWRRVAEETLAVFQTHLDCRKPGRRSGGRMNSLNKV